LKLKRLPTAAEVAKACPQGIPESRCGCAHDPGVTWGQQGWHFTIIVEGAVTIEHTGQDGRTREHSLSVGLPVAVGPCPHYIRARREKIATEGSPFAT